jgi:integrase/recombinase XerD
MDRVNGGVESATARNGELIELYEVDLRVEQRKPKSTISCYMADVRNASRIFSDMGITFAEIRKEHLKQYVRTVRDETERPNGLQIGRLKNLFTSLNSMMEFLIYEEMAEVNVIPAYRRRYLKTYKTESTASTPRQVPLDEKLAEMIYDIHDPMNHALHLLLAKTGIRRGEAMSLDIESIHLVEKYILLKHTNKRTNRRIPFDAECADALERYLRSETSYRRLEGERALFVNRNGRRCDKNTISRMVNKPAEAHGLHDPGADRLDQHLKFGPHNYRYWFTTALRKRGCPERIIRFLRGDAEGTIVDRYDRIDWEDAVEAYNAYMPSLIAVR